MFHGVCTTNDVYIVQFSGWSNRDSNLLECFGEQAQRRTILMNRYLTYM